MSYESERQWRKITYGLRNRPVVLSGDRSLPASKGVKGISTSERVRLEEGRRRRRAVQDREVQPFSLQSKAASPPPPPLSHKLRHAFKTPEELEGAPKKGRKLPPLAPSRKRRSKQLDELSISSTTSTIPDVSKHFPLTVVEKVRSDISREHACHTIAATADDTTPQAEGLTPEQHQAAKAALAADTACPNRILIESMRHLLLAHTAYRVPTGSEFWDRIKAIQQGTSKASAGEVYRKYRREATALLQNVHDFLNRVYVCTGRKLNMVSHTKLDLGTFEKFGIESPMGPLSPQAALSNTDIDSTQEAQQLFRIGANVLINPQQWKGRVRAHDGNWVTVYTDDEERRVRAEEVVPRGGYPKGWKVKILEGVKVVQRGTVTGSGRGRVGVRLVGEKQAHGCVAETVFTDQQFTPDMKVVVRPPQIVGKVIGHARGRVGVQTPDGIVGCMPGALYEIKGASTEGLWTLATCLPGLEALKCLAAVQTAAEEAEEQALREEKLIMQEAPVVAPGWVIVADDDEPTSVTICIAGTQNFNDCFRDCMFIPVNLEVPPIPGDIKSPRSVEPPEEYKGLKVHMGFLDGANRIFEQIVPAVIAQRRKHGPLRVTLTGHSLGGATAILLATFLDVSDIDGVCVESVFTYGAPNILNIKEWDGTQPILKEVNVHQYVNERDLVPRALGSSLMRKLAKVGIRMGFKALSCVTTSNAESLPFYRFTSPVLHYINSGKVESITDRTAQQDVLSLSIIGMRPVAVSQHRMSDYITNLLDIYNKETNHTHTYKLEPTLNPANAIGSHRILTAVFDAKDPTKLSSTMAAACSDIYTRMEGIDIRKLSTLCYWSDKVYPENCMKTRVFSGAYGTAPNTRKLSEEGWQAFMEDACYSDLPWVARLLECMDWVQDGDKLKKTKKLSRGAADIPKPPPVFRGVPLLDEEGSLGSEALCAAKKIFKTYARHLPMDAYSPERVRGGSWSPRRKTVLLRPECMRVLMRSLEACEYGEGYTPEQSRLVALASSCVDDLRHMRNPTSSPLVDPFGNITERGFVALFAKWCREDEVRIWGILCKGGGYNELLTMHVASGMLWDTTGLDEAVTEANKIMMEEQEQKQALFERQVKYALYKMYVTRRHTVEGPMRDKTGTPQKRRSVMSPRRSKADISRQLQLERIYGAPQTLDGGRARSRSRAVREAERRATADDMRVYLRPLPPTYVVPGKTGAGGQPERVRLRATEDEYKNVPSTRHPQMPYSHMVRYERKGMLPHMEPWHPPGIATPRAVRFNPEHP